MKKKTIYFLMTIPALLAGCQGEKKPPVGNLPGSPTARARYTQLISHRWRMDMDHMREEMRSYRDSVAQTANALNQETGEAEAHHLDSQVNGWLNDMESWRQEFFPDGRWLSMRPGKTINARYAFSPGLDSLYLQDPDGKENMERLALVSISDTTFTLIQKIMIPTADQSPEKRIFYHARYKYIRE